MVRLKEVFDRVERRMLSIMRSLEQVDKSAFIVVRLMLTQTSFSIFRDII